MTQIWAAIRTNLESGDHCQSCEFLKIVTVIEVAIFGSALTVLCTDNNKNMRTDIIIVSNTRYVLYYLELDPTYFLIKPMDTGH